MVWGWFRRRRKRYNCCETEIYGAHVVAHVKNFRTEYLNTAKNKYSHCIDRDTSLLVRFFIVAAIPLIILLHVQLLVKISSFFVNISNRDRISTKPLTIFIQGDLD